MKRFLLIFLSFCLLCRQGSAQSFDRVSWDFGKIKEADGVVSHVFMFRNDTGKPVRITGSVPSCNCIMAQLPDGDIAPGKTADIVVFFSPSGAAGPAHRTIEILGPRGASLGILSTDADVTPEDRSIEERYPIVLAPSLYANMNTIPFGYMKPGEKASKVIYLANSSDGWMEISTAVKGSGNLQVRCPEMIAPGKEVPVMLTYTMPSGENYKTHHDTLRIHPRTESSYKRESFASVQTSAICLTKGGGGASMRVFPNTGALKKKLFRNTLHSTVEITNDGTDDLIINAIEAPAAAKFSIVPGTHIEPGATVRAELEATGPASVRLFTNDPKRPYKDIIFKP